MAFYEWVCDKCKIFWEREYPLAKNPERTRCPQCKKLSDRLWGAPPPVHFKGTGWTSGPQGFNKKGGSDEVNLKLQEGCKERMSTGWQQYARFTPPQKLLDKARKLTDGEVAHKLDASKKVSAHNYDKAGIDGDVISPQVR